MPIVPLLGAVALAAAAPEVAPQAAPQVAHTAAPATPEKPVAIEKRARPGVTRLYHPEHHANCRWSLEPHTHEDDAPLPRGLAADVVTVFESGPPSNRVDLVIVGDGYTAGELGTFAAHAQSGIDDLFNTPPFDQYSELFNVHRVEVVSAESGVDDDPQGVQRDTALDMRFYCFGVERALCVNVSKAQAYASLAPDWDQIFAVANSQRYGGVGYPSSNVGTYAGGNALAPQVAIHELGHSLGNLADEYAYGGPSNYSGAEPAARNVSIYDASEMAARNAKWAPWLGETDPAWDALVSTFEGANTSETGIFRPTDNSLMRALGRPFNLPSAEGLIIEMWKIVAPIDSATPTSQPLLPTQTVSVQPAASFLTVRWSLDGELIRTGPTLNLATVDLPAGASELVATVIDETPLVRDEAARDAFMTERRVWSIAATPGDLSGDGAVDSVDLAILIAAWGTADADITGDGVTNAADLAALLAAWAPA
jgi:hypothetical protein